MMLPPIVIRHLAALGSYAATRAVEFTLGGATKAALFPLPLMRQQRSGCHPPHSL